jgi:putative transposase
MPRKQRDIAPGFPNHIVTRGNNRRRLFSYPRDYIRFLGLASRAHAANQCRINAVALMSNHIHLLQTPPSSEAASTCVKAFSQRYAQIRNAQRDGSGKLFEQRFYNKPVRSDAQLGLTICYIDANPVVGGVVEKAIDYPYSTYAIHAGEPEKCALPRAAWTPSPWYLALGRSPTARETAYRECFDLYLSTKKYPDHQPEFAHIEELSFQPYRRRLLRPNGSRASDGF